ncbi:MAG: DMT family transporter [Myxococcales bacterium]|nr:DMT family transporter [Myxococcales bacterium]
MSASHRTVGFGLAALGAFLYATKAILVKLALQVGATVEQLLLLRMATALPVFLGVGSVAWRRSERRPSGSQLVVAAALGVLSYHVCAWLDFQSLTYISVQLERLILFVYPTFVALMAWAFLGDRITPRHAASLALSYLGVLILFGREAGELGQRAAMGGALVLSAAVLFALYMVLAKRPIRRMGSPLFNSVAMTAACLSILVVSGLGATQQAPPPFTWAIVGYGAAIGVFCTVLPSFMVAEAIARVGPGQASAVGALSPVLTAALAVGVLGEAFEWPHATGLVLTGVGVVLLTTSTAPAERPVTG